jgi:uncharacterized protein with von Willebrand factor type A (vWA) domain
MSGTEQAKAKEDAAAIMRAKQAAGKSLYVHLFEVYVERSMKTMHGRIC